ncbi:PR-1-like protein [Decorospora gaudefroyi]|uniref:PR-1-like protein n=1 Tax=Decorospora gaudefroyi TaxID=184978 RepID=A0A6A5K2W4_9PLEO|nr:PR-1-like protein [Decorospora gaudefroyi]
MRSSIFIAPALVMGVLARPHPHRPQPKIVYETEVVIQTVVVTLTMDYVEPDFTSHTLSITAKPTATPTPEPAPQPKPDSLSLSFSSSSSSSSSEVLATHVPSATAAAAAPKPATHSNRHISGTDQAYLSAGADYKASILFHHNSARANHNAAPLIWDSECENNARIAAETCNFKHFIPQGAGQGQNLFTVSGDAFNATAGISENWYKGELPEMMPWFGQSNIPRHVFEQVGHLTQMVWKATTKVGCVSLDCGNAMIVGGKPSSMNKYTVCNYAPAGNVGGQYAANVASPISFAKLGGWAD